MGRKWLSVQNSVDGKTATIDIEGPIGGNFWDGSGASKENVKAELKQIASLKAETIIVNIDSLGGRVDHAMSIHDLLAANPAKKEVRINGATASAATVIAMAGDTIKMSDNALFLPHRPLNIYAGNINDIKAGMEELEKFEGVMVNIYAKRTKRSIEDINAQLDVNNGNGEWMTSDEAKAFGFVDEIFEPTKMAASADPSMLAMFKLPSLPTSKIKNPNTIQMKIEDITKAIKDGISAAFKGKGDDSKPTDEQLNKVAGEQAAILKADYDAKISDASKKVKDEAEAAHLEVVKAKDLEITNAKADVIRLTAELAASKAGETTVVKAADPNPGATGKTVRTKNQINADKNAAILRGDVVEEDEDEEEEETPENKRKK